MSQKTRTLEELGIRFVEARKGVEEYLLESINSKTYSNLAVGRNIQ